MKSHYLLRICLVFIMFGLLQSCSKEKLLSDGEINAQKIQSVINDENINYTRIYRYDDLNRWDNVRSSDDFEIDGTFIRVEKTYYNLEKLQKYYFNDYNDGEYLSLYFN